MPLISLPSLTVADGKQDLAVFSESEEAFWQQVNLASAGSGPWKLGFVWKNEAFVCGWTPEPECF